MRRITAFLLCVALAQCATKPACLMDGNGYELRNHQVHYWYLTDDLTGLVSNDDRDRVVADADYSSFQGLSDRERSGPSLDQACYQSYGKDARHVFHGIAIIEGADPQTFEAIGHGLARDKNYRYESGKATCKFSASNPVDLPLCG